MSTGVEFAWNPQRVYYGGDEANHGTRRYRAAWYTKGDNPTAGSPWSDVGANTCNQTPTANAGADQSVTVGASVTLDGSASSDPDTGDTLTYSWSHTSGTPSIALTGSTTASPTFTAPTVSASTAFVFTLTVSDGTATATDTVTVTVAPASTNTAPTANAGADQSVTAGTLVTLDGSGSSDPDSGDVLQYTWTQTAGTVVTLSAGSLAGQATFTAPADTQPMVFRLLVSDGTDSASDTVTITVTGEASQTGSQDPVARAGADQRVAANTTVTLDGTKSYDPHGRPLTYPWAQSGGTPTLTLTGSDTTKPSFTIPGSREGLTFSFDLTVSVPSGANSLDTVTITSEPINRAPTAEAGPDQTVDAGASVTLDGSGSSDPGR